MKLFPLLRQLLEVGLLLGALVVALRFVTGLFRRRQPVYRLTATRQLRLLFWPLLTLAVGLPLLASGLLAASFGVYEAVLLGSVAALISGFVGPALVLHLQYYWHNQATVLVFDPKRNQLEVYEHGQRLPFERRDVVRVERVVCRSRRLFWSPYDYLRLHLASGTTLTLTSLLLNLDELTDFLRNLPLTQQKRWWCTL